MAQNIFAQLFAKQLHPLFMVALAVVLALGVGLVPVVQAVTFTVNTTTDAIDTTPGDGVCAAAGGQCTLRASIQEANALAGTDTITLPAGTYTLTLRSELTIDQDLTLTGAGAGDTIIQGYAEGPPPPGLPAFRIFTISFGAIVAISGVTVRHGSGGIQNYGVLSLADSTISNNNGRDTSAGGIWNEGTLTLNNSAIINNTAIDAGGILNYRLLTLTNTTVGGNTANSTGGGIYIGCCVRATVTIINSTINGNTARVGLSGGIYISNSPATTVELVNTIVANNSGGNCSHGITSLGYNLDSDGSCGLMGTGDLSGVDPLLGLLADNAGSTFTYALLPGSPAIDAGSPDCPPPATDQRGAVRPGGTACDIGAYEFGSTPVSADLSVAKDDSPDPVTVSSPLTYTVTVTNNGPDVASGVVVRDTLPTGATFVSSSASQGTCSGTGTITCNLGTINNSATATVTIVVTPLTAGEIINTVIVTGTESDLAPRNNTATAVTTVIGPALSLTLTGCTTCRAGDRFTVQAHATNPGSRGVTVEAKIGVRLPDGTPVNLVGNKHLEVPLPAGLDTTFTLFDVPSLPDGLPTGTWIFEGTLLGPDLGETFSREMKPFDVMR